MKLNFDTLANRRKVGYMLKRHLKIYEWVFDIVNDEELRRWKFTGEEVKLKLYESNLDPVLRLMHITGIQSTGWLDSGSDCTDTNYANTDIDITCSNWKN